MKKRLLLFLVIFSPFVANAQFEQKVSLNFAAGAFKTFGTKLGVNEPMQMPNYKTGFSASGGAQFKLSNRFSLSVDLGFMVSERWDYHTGDDNNYLHWSINDPITSELIAEGENYLDIFNYSIDIKPIYYLNQPKKLNFFLYTGISFNSTTAYYEDTQWAKLSELGMLPADDTGPYNDNLEKNIGLGLNPGLGLEFFPKERVGFNLTTGYYFMLLNKKNFKNSEREENFNAVIIQAGLRFYFIKSKDL